LAFGKHELMQAADVTTEFPAKEKAEMLFGEYLVSKGLITRRELSDALAEQRDNPSRLGEVLIRLKMLEADKVTESLAEHLGIEHIHLDDMSKVDMNVARMVPESIARRFCLVAIAENDGRVTLAMTDPLNVVAIDTIALKIKRQIKVVVSSANEIVTAIETIYHGSDVEEQRLRDLVETEVESEQDKDSDLLIEDISDESVDSTAAASKAPVIRFVDLLLSQATKSRASDIHIEPQERSMSIRMRIDGRLRDMVPPARKMQAAVITRIKILSKMDIAERRLPQDGRFKMKASGRAIDVRVNAIPTIYGEKIVMRILDASAVNHNIEEIGFEPALLDKFKRVLNQPHGIIVVTGPTGSGKSTTLYSALSYLKDPTKNITTVEDPVEYRLAGINQIQVKSEINLTFASCLRAILRQDPDIVLIGEIRDKETMEIAIQASLTGHLVLSTFHTNDAPSAISRFCFMGLERYLLASSLDLIIAQRLVRRICEKCKEPVEYDEVMLKELKITTEEAKSLTFYKGKGCIACGNTGYKGRLPVFEFLMLDNDVREAIVRGENESEIRQISRSKGYGGLLESGISKIKQGLTTPEEVLGVTFAESID
jgi:type IV pilus assembly protein PilB